MAQATRKANTRSPLAIHLAQGLKEAALWVFLAIAVLLFVCLLTYSPHDPSPFYSGEGGPIHNAIGPVGAWLAAALYFLIGYPAYLFPFLLAWAGWMIFRNRKATQPMNKLQVTLRVGGLILALLTAAGLTSLNWHITPGALPADAGGVFGDAIGKGMGRGLSDLGATLLLLALFLSAVTVFTGLSWIALMDRIGRFSLIAAERARNRWGWLREAIQARRSREQQIEIVRLHQEEVQSRPKPRIEPVVKSVEPSPRVERERQVPLFEPPSDAELPPLALLDDPPPKVAGYSEAALEAMSRTVELKLKDFGVDVQVVAVNPGPVVTRFELQPAPGVKVSQISNLAKDMARGLSAISVRVVEVIPGKSVIGLEIPNEARELVTLGEILKSREYDESRSPLTLALGKDIGGNPVVADLERMPHLLIAGTTGSGKSVALNAMTLSLLYKATPEDTRLIMIDPKMLELSVYEGIPHLLAPVVTDMKEAANALRWCVVEMERRYRLMAAVSVRNLAGYNRKIKDAMDAGRPIRDPLLTPEQLNELDDADIPTLTPLPSIVVVVDEIADMMLVVGKKVEELITRLAQKARASGLHLILATQRPSVDVITGLIKANIPARIAFQVSARVDSRTILDQQGAESLLGHGDMLFLPPGTSVPMRVHGAFVSDQEVHRVVDHLRKGLKGNAPNYMQEILQAPAESLPGIPGLEAAGGEGSDAESDPLYDQAVRIVTETRRASISGVQRRLKIGYNRAARMIEQMEVAGIVGPLQTNGMREVLVAPPPGTESDA
ncbi:MAG: DNA translocase FtsK 4TM domain-containing protein [Gammaproteobacteria bacterium]|nr:DNA translocase FtsK 4TM domain-containing protein [Gammaproteobacteria bacterium]